MIVFCDIDGIVADCTHRLKYLEKKDYEKFYSAEMIMEDAPIPAGIELIGLLVDSPTVTFNYLTGRPYRTQKTTSKWLAQFSLESPLMFMRHDHDFRKSEIVKAEIMKKYIEHEQPDDIILFIDDDPLNVAGVCSVDKRIVGITFGADRLNRIIEFHDRYKELCK